MNKLRWWLSAAAATSLVVGALGMIDAPGLAAAALAGPVRSEFCGQLSSEHLAVHRQKLGAQLQLDAAQMQALGDVESALQSTLSDADALCQQLRRPSTIPEAMSMTEQWLVLAQRGVADAKPAVARFYDALNDSQQAELDQWLDHRTHHARRQRQH